MTTLSLHVGEVVESATDRLLAQSYTVNQAPALGSLVRVPAGFAPGACVYGVVDGIETASVDTSRKPVARGQHATSVEQIYAEHPQLTQLFRTLFNIRVVGHQTGEAMLHFLPPTPPEVHQLVFLCTQEELAAFTERLGFLPTLLGGREGGLADETAAAFLRAAAIAHGQAGEAFLVRAGKELVSLLRGDGSRLITLLARLR